MTGRGKGSRDGAVGAPRRAFRKPADRHLRSLTLLLVAFGLVMVYSSSNVLAMHEHGNSAHFFISQSLKALLGLLAMMAVTAIDYRAWERFAKLFLWLAVGLLAFLAVPMAGALTPEINGARRWIVLPAFTFQPIELAKLALIVWMATILARRGDQLDRGFDPLVPLLVMPGLMAGLALLQPDFKGALLLVVLAGTMLFLGGVAVRYLARIMAVAVPVAIGVMVLEPYRLRRLTTYFDPSTDVQGISYQINQSLISLGSGGWFGVGLTSSKQKYAFLPMAHTDFIVSIIGEELGVVGTIGLLLAYLYLGALGFRIARRAPDTFGFLLASGVTTLIAGSALLNMGVATAALPTTGLPLPFISYGGTALIVDLIAIGILLSVSRDQVEPTRRFLGDGGLRARLVRLFGRRRGAGT
ncbi:MAG: putative lipid II flippase FtsW [Gemmatimonadota bacterium]